MIAGELRYENFLNDLISKSDGKIHLIVGHGNMTSIAPKVFYEESKDNYDINEVNYACVTIYGQSKSKSEAPTNKTDYQVKHGLKEVMISYSEQVGFYNGEIEWNMENLKLRTE